MDRRTFLAQTATGAAGLGLTPWWFKTSCLAEEPAENLTIIDCHTHFYDPHRPEGVPWPPRESTLYRTVLPEDLRALPKHRPLTGTVVVEASPWLEDNVWLLELAQQDPFIVGIVGHLRPDEPEFDRHVVRLAQNPLFRGIRIQLETLNRLRERNELHLLQPLANHDLALDVNGGPGLPLAVSEVADRLPDLRFVLNHIGNVHLTHDPPPAEWTAGMQAAARHPNVFAKLSALVEGASRNGVQAPTDLDFYRPYIDAVWNAFGDERMIYGSNWPVSDLAADYVTVQRLALEYAGERGREALEGFCSRNALRAYKYVVREATG